jgi:fumarylacetoacetate (FAA) hydrolase
LPMPPRRVGSAPVPSSARAPSPTSSLGGRASPLSRAAGYTCLAELRTTETLSQGKPRTPFLTFGDRVRIEMWDEADRSIFGAIDQEVVKYTK